MTASDKLAYPPIISQIPKHGVLAIHGYGVHMRMQRGHLEIGDGVGPERRSFRLPRVGHRLRRVVCISEDGFITLSALKWLSDIGVPFIMLDRLGKVRLVTGPISPSDVRLRRAQATAAHTGVDVIIARELISQKLTGQERVAREIIHDSTAADEIADYRLSLAEAENLDAIRLCESRGASAFWAAWQGVPVLFPTKDLPRIPVHWRKFDTRKSPLTGSQRLAVDPINCCLNYLYSLLEAESRLALAKLGLDPGLGFIHVDTPARDSLACDLMEVGRPTVDAYVLQLLQQPLRRDWFFETKEGNCRLMASFAAQLSETAPMWARAVAPCAEWIVKKLWTSTGKRAGPDRAIPTRLTQSRRVKGRGNQFIAPPLPSPKREPICRSCGATTQGRQHCPKCGREISAKKLTELAKAGRVAALRPESRKKHSETQRRHRAAQRAWLTTHNPALVTERYYLEKIQPALASVAISKISSTLGVCESYAADIRAGRHRPHPRHWEVLSRLLGMGRELQPSLD